MTGVTIGVGRYVEMARKSAAAMSQRTGLRTVVLSDNINKQAKKTTPHHLKFELFNYVDDDDILYFDADLVCIQEWSPQQYIGTKSVIAVRDLWFYPPISEDAKRLGMAARRYFNSGFLIINRNAHQRILALAGSLLKAITPYPFRDQSHLNIATELLDIPVCYLDRRYNWIGYCDSEVSHLSKPINCHFTGSKKRSAGVIPQVELDKLLRVGKHIREDLFRSIAGLYTYERVGMDKRSLFLAPDGTVGFNSARMELYWFPFEDKNKLFIAIVSRDQVTCILEKNTDQWTGKWQRYEKMPTILHAREATIPSVTHNMQLSDSTQRTI